jgi:hypothetical protein
MTTTDFSKEQGVVQNAHTRIEFKYDLNDLGEHLLDLMVWKWKGSVIGGGWDWSGHVTLDVATQYDLLVFITAGNFPDLLAQQEKVNAERTKD